MADPLHELAEHIGAAMPNAVTGVAVAHGELTINARTASIIELLTFLRRDAACRFKMLIDITAVDHPGREQRFDVVYVLLSLAQNQRVRVKLAVAENESVASATTVYKAAGWFEREVWDLFGIPFADHPDLRRLLTDYGFEGHPLRKDFPLTGHVELRYDVDQKRVVYEPVKLVQEFRSFDFESPWEGMADILHGDEKATTDDDDGAGAKGASGTGGAA